MNSNKDNVSTVSRRSLHKDKDDDKIVEDLLQGMSLEEQIGQMSQIDIVMLTEDDNNGGKRLNIDQVKHFIGELGIGSVLNTVPVPWTAADYRQAAIQIQDIAKEYHRPPVIWGIDSVHGANYIKGANWTPQPINLAATFNVTVAHQAGALASRDTRAAGIAWLFSPLLGIALQPYWSRVYETFGEDPLVVGKMAAAMIEGIQTADANPAAVPSRAAACAKHFVGYSFPHNGHDRAPSWIPRRHLYQYFVPPWQQAMNADVLTVMESYNDIDGVPNAANPETTRYLLRQRLGFEGVLVTDYQEILNLHDWHKTAGDAESAVVQALTHGTVDMSMIPWDADGFRNGATAAVQQNRIATQRIQESARRVLKLKQQLHMFSEELNESDPNVDLVGTDDEAMLDMARQSIVLTKNANDSTLPWNASKGKKVLVTGPTAASLIYQSGGWSGQWQGPPNEDDWITTGSSVLKAMSANAAGLDISYACGTNILGGECDDDTSEKGIMDQVEGWVGLGPHNSVGRAAQAAEDVNLVVICVGEEAYTEKPGDIRSLRLPDGQNELVYSIQQNTKAKIVLVYFGGRPRLLGTMVEQSDAVLVSFLPGPSGGEAIADIILGNVNPSGRLPMTYPAFDDAAGSPYFHAVSDQCTAGTGKMPHYEYASCEVQWPFGHGLSYTTFEYSGLTVTGYASTDVQISFNVRNSGTMAGAEAIMIFTFDEYRPATPEYKRLRHFQKVYLASGESTSITTTLTRQDLEFIGADDDSHFIIDPQKPFWVGIGASVDCRSTPDDALCAKVEGGSLETFVDPSCTAACSLWMDSGCSKTAGLSKDRCIDMCTKAGEKPLTYSGVGSKGWGWNYVQCLESVVWGMQQSETPQCEEMTMLCRDIFRTEGLNQFGSGPFVAPPTQGGTSPTTFVALLAGLISSVVIFLSLRGSCTKFNNDRHDEMEVQFTSVSNQGSDHDDHGFNDHFNDQDEHDFS